MPINSTYPVTSCVSILSDACNYHNKRMFLYYLGVQKSTGLPPGCSSSLSSCWNVAPVTSLDLFLPSIILALGAVTGAGIVWLVMDLRQRIRQLERVPQDNAEDVVDEEPFLNGIEQDQLPDVVSEITDRVNRLERITARMSAHANTQESHPISDIPHPPTNAQHTPDLGQDLASIHRRISTVESSIVQLVHDISRELEKLSARVDGTMTTSADSGNLTPPPAGTAVESPAEQAHSDSSADLDWLTDQPTVQSSHGHSTLKTPDQDAAKMGSETAAQPAPTSAVFGSSATNVASDEPPAAPCKLSMIEELDEIPPCLPVSSKVTVYKIPDTFRHTIGEHDYLLMLALLYFSRSMGSVSPDWIGFDDLGREMLVHAAYPVVYRGVQFGDEVPAELKTLRLPTPYRSQQTIRAAITSLVPKPSPSLTSNAPYRLLRQFFPRVIGFTPDELHKNIAEESRQLFKSAAQPFYQINPERDKILLHPDWHGYFLNNYEQVYLWTLYEFTQFLKKMNPDLLNAFGCIAPPDRPWKC